MQFQLDGFNSNQVLYESQNSTVFRATELKNNRSVVIKWVNSNASPKLHSNLQTEFEVAKIIKSQWTILVYELIKNSHGSFLIMEDFGAISLKEYLFSNRISLKQFIRLALEICEAINSIHSQNVIHKDINPSNFVIHPEKQNVKLIDFGISSLLRRSDQESIDPIDLEGTLSYISPEQTGRMNCSIDYRSDFYSLGITFYEMLFRELPFKNHDPMSLIHYHIAGKPNYPLDELNKKIPEILTSIIDKLIAKNVEDRYQNIKGLKFDLEECQKQLTEKGTISFFSIGTRDFSDKLLIAQKLYGRQDEVNSLLSAFDTMFKNGGFHFVTVGGYSGVGKTSLIQEIHKPILEKRGYFLSGKYDQYLKNIPYSALTDSLKLLVRQILSEPEEKLVKWKAKILDSVGNSGRVIFEILPELELVIGKQPEIPLLESIENQNRFQSVFSSFIRAIATKEHPIVFFLDDLQWADFATLSLIEEIALVPDGLFLLIIGAYRENEVGDAHPLTLALKSFQETNVPITKISLSPLENEHINELLSDSFHLNILEVKTLSELIFKKTAGNPYFLIEFIKSLYAEKLIYFDHKNSIWCWEIGKIQERGFSDDAAEFMSEKVLELGNESLNVLKIASVLGNRFSLNSLSELVNQDQKILLNQFLPSIEMELILSKVDIFKLMHRDNLEIKEKDIHFKFAHDKVQQVVYELLSEKERIEIHYKYGNQLLQKYSNNLEEEVFLIVDNLNLSVSIISDKKELEQLANLNLIAGKRARVNTAYQHALTYFQFSIRLLNDLDINAQDTYQLYYELADTAQLLGKYEIMESSIEVCLEKANSLLERIKAIKIRLVSLMSRNLLQEEMDVGLELLKILNVDIPHNPNNLQVIFSIFKTLRKVNKFKKENLVYLEKSTDSLTLEKMEIINLMLFVSYYIRPNLTPILVLKGLRITIEEGYGRHSILFILALPNILCHHMGKVEQVMDYLPICMKLLDKIQDKASQSMVYYYIKQFFIFVKFPLKEKMNYYEISIRLGQESGSYLVSSLSIINMYAISLFLDENLNTVKNRMQKYLPVVKQMNQIAQINSVLFYDSIFEFLIKSNSRWMNLEKFEDYTNSIDFFNQSKDDTALSVYYLSKTILYVLFRDKEKSLKYIEFMHQKRTALSGQIYFSLSMFFSSLAYLNIYIAATKKQQKLYKKRVKEYQKKMLFWSKHCPENFLNKWQLVEAERYRVLKKDSEAIKYYQLAIDSAHKNGFLMEEGLANELAAEFWLSRSNYNIGTFYILAANKVYTEWGALAKVDQLRSKYNELLRIWNTNSSPSIHSTFTQLTTHGSKLNHSLDLNTIIKASQTISAEIKIKNLLEKLLNIIIENAGAERSVMIMVDKNRMNIQAEAKLEGKSFFFYEMSPTNIELPLKILEYVKHSRQSVILHNADEEGQFRNDSYILKNNIKSVLCLPILKQDSLFAILYLENSLTKAAFTSERVEIINILSSQVALSLENSLLYSNLEAKVLERTSELREALTIVEKQHSELQETQSQLIQSEKMATLGQLVANVAHEINTPIGAVKASGKNISDALERTLESMPKLFDLLDSQPRGLFLKLIGNSKEQANILSTREERALIREAAQKLDEHKIEDSRTIAEILVILRVHEAIDDFLPLIIHPERDFIFKTAKNIGTIVGSAGNINSAVDKVSKIIFALKSFSRLSNSEAMVKSDIREGIEIVLIIYQNHFKKGIEIIRNYEEIPLIECLPDELNQVWTNLIHNAIQAMVEVGKISIGIRLLGKEILVSIADTGSGIPESIRSKIFDAFFTTKPSGVGSGLGLDIVKKIIGKHNGRIEVKSEVGVGSEFLVYLPVKDA